MAATNGASEAASFDGLKYAQSLDFTEQQYEEAVKRVKSPNDINQLLVALLEVSNHTNQANDRVQDASIEMQCDSQQQQQYESSSTNTAGTSGYSSTASTTTSTASSSSQSLDTLATQSQQHLTSSSQGSLNDLTLLTDRNNSFNDLRRVYVDGSNVARTHGKNEHFSWIGIRQCVDWFQRRGHKVKVLVPENRCALSASNPVDASVLAHLKQSNVLIETPLGCNDDMFIIEAARQNNGIIVSNDMYRDERRRFGSTENLDQFITLNRLPYVFDDDLFIPASDPRGRAGPQLEDFLRSHKCQPQQQQQQHHHHQLLRHRRSGPARIHCPVIVEEQQINQPPVERLLPSFTRSIQRLSSKQVGGGGNQSAGAQAAGYAARDRNSNGLTNSQRPVARLQLCRTKSDNDRVAY